jgi:hypothetical protein
LSELADLDDDQLLFFWTGGKSVTHKRPENPSGVTMKIDRKLSWAQNMEKFEAAKRDHEELTIRGQNR